jgi:hypothetical protein
MREFFRGGWLGLEHFAKSWCTHTELAIKVDRLSPGASRWSSPGHPSAFHPWLRLLSHQLMETADAVSIRTSPRPCTAM